ncbi:hypothetical protein EON66_07935 [archaeon]|nr:MAG: hypothetical protein EON66_07935 [archaeon]
MQQLQQQHGANATIAGSMPTALRSLFQHSLRAPQLLAPVVMCVLVAEQRGDGQRAAASLAPPLTLAACAQLTPAHASFHTGNQKQLSPFLFFTNIDLA